MDWHNLVHYRIESFHLLESKHRRLKVVVELIVRHCLSAVLVVVLLLVHVLILVHVLMLVVRLVWRLVKSGGEMMVGVMLVVVLLMKLVLVLELNLVLRGVERLDAARVAEWVAGVVIARLRLLEVELWLRVLLMAVYVEVRVRVCASVVVGGGLVVVRVSMKVACVAIVVRRRLVVLRWHLRRLD